MAGRGRDDDDDGDSSSGRSNESDEELETITKDDTQDIVKLIDPTSLWRDISQDKDLEQILTDLEKMRRLEKRNKEKGKTLTQQEQQRREELEASRRSKENCYRPRIKECLERPTTSERPFIHVVIYHASGTTLLMTNFITRLILEQEPNQIQQLDSKGVPLLHKAIEVEVSNLPGCKGLTSGICKLAKDADKAIEMTNSMNENCLHLVVRHNIHDAKGIISLSDPKALKQKRHSTSRDQMDSNTPLHDALDFSKVAKRKIPCEEGQPTKQGLQICDECADAAKANEKLPGLKTYYDRMIKPLLKKCPEVLKEHNAFGLPPYAFHLETRTERTQELSRSTRTESATEQNNGSRNRGGEDQLASRRDKLRPGNEPKPGLHKRAPTTTNFDNAKLGIDGRPSESINYKTREGREKARENPKNQTSSQFDQGFQTHRESRQYDLNTSDEIVASLEGWIDKMAWGYEDIIECLFQSTKAKPRNTGSKPKNRTFELPTRVALKTTENFNFLEFESRLALLFLSLRPDNLYDVGQSEEKREEQAAFDADNIINVFRWLKEKKQVKKILKVVVEDNPNQFCSDETIESCLECMDEIRFLNWNKRDLSVPTLSKAKGLTELSLYSSGINAVLHHWSDQNGLVKLHKLRKINLHVEKGLEGATRNQANIREFMNKLKGSCEAIAKNREIEVVIDMVGMGEAGNTPSGKHRSKWLPSTPQKHAGFEAAEKFASVLYNKMSKTNSIGRKVKVALLDDGVNPEYKNIGRHLAGDGFPQASLDGHIAPFYKSTRGHGSMMASIISTICPFVEIYVAKIDNQEYLPHPAYNVEQATAAVDWAVNEKVDIISMSWILRVTNEIRGEADNLNEMLDSNHSNIKKMILYCAARDNRGNDLADAVYYPADCRSTKSIGGADTFNQPLRFVTLDKTDFVFPSESVLPSEERAEGGNSVATAVATGVAALVLYCLREDKVRLKTDSVSKVKLMELLFKKLRDKNTRYVDLAELFTCRDDEVITPKLLADRVLAKAGLVRSDMDGFAGEGSFEKYSFD